MTEAEIYVSVALLAIAAAPASQPELRKWWSSEADARRRYGLTQEQEDQLTEACRIRIPQLPEETPASTIPPEPRAWTGGRSAQPRKQRRYAL